MSLPNRFSGEPVSLETISPSAFDELSLWSAPFGLKLLELVALRPGIVALDVGCGPGFPLIELAQRLGPASQVHGLDPWGAGLARAREKLSALGVENVTLHQGRAEEIPLDDASVDLIVSNVGLNNVADLDAAVAECARVARPGAQLVYAYNLPETMHELYRTYDGLLHERGLEHERTVLAAHIFAKRKPLAFTSALFERTGFRIERLHQGSFALRYADASAMFDHFFIRIAFLPSWLEVLGPTEREPVFSELERRLNARARAEGGLTLTVPFACFDCRRLGAPQPHHG